MMTQQRPTSSRWTPILSALMILLCAAAMAMPAAAQEKGEAFTVMTLDPEGLMTEGFFEAGGDDAEEAGTLGSHTQGILGGGGQGCTGGTCISVVGGANDSCSECDLSCPETEHNNVVVWSTSDYGTYVDGAVICASNSFKYEDGNSVCRSDHLGAHCKDCGSCFYTTNYCPF